MRRRDVARFWVTAALVGIAPSRASAQPAPPADGVAIGDFWFRPSFEARVRGEYFHHPVETLGDVAVLGTELGAPLDITHQWVVHERARIGLGVERGALAGAVVVQDARVAGFPAATNASDGLGTATTSFHVAYLEAHSAEVRPSFIRLGRQEIAWGEGRLLGISDWLLTPRSLDAARARWSTRQLDVEALAALLSAPGSLPPQYAAQTPNGADLGTGAQLYGLDAVLHLDPLLHAEIAGLARVARAPLPTSLTPSDTFVLDARVFGDRSGFAYAGEVALERGHVAVVASSRPIEAWAATAHVDWQPGWLLRPRLSVGGSYASGGGDRSDPSRRFDPILPDARNGLGQMGLYGWSNILDAYFSLATAPFEDTTFALAYRHVRLADPKGAWFSASLLPVGQNGANEDAFLGYELDAFVSYAPFDGLALSGGYGALFTGDGARAILAGRPDRGPKLLSAAFLQASLSAP